MKIKSLCFNNIGPLKCLFDFTDEWRGSIHERILFTGPNGSGKTLTLKTIAILWNALGHWLDHRSVTPAGSPVHQALRKEQSAAMVLTDLPHHPEPVILFFGNPSGFDQLVEMYPDQPRIGETKEHDGRRTLQIPEETWIDHWADARKKLIQGFNDSDTPNIVWLDAEQRQKGPLKQNTERHLFENPAIRWLITEQDTAYWQEQLDASRRHQYHNILREMAGLFCSRKSNPHVESAASRLQMTTGDQQDRSHTLNELSAGEYHTLKQIFIISRWLQPGGIVLIDEPVLFLHPSLIPAFLSRLESLVSEKQGQLFITSHNPDVWRRYERKGLRVVLRNIS